MNVIDKYDYIAAGLRGPLSVCVLFLSAVLYTVKLDKSPPKQFYYMEFGLGQKALSSIGKMYIRKLS